jgi:hypothetical protein
MSDLNRGERLQSCLRRGTPYAPTEQVQLASVSSASGATPLDVMLQSIRLPNESATDKKDSEGYRRP